MNAQLTQIRAQHHIADLQRTAAHRRHAPATDAEPAKPQRVAPLQHWLVLSLLTALRIS